MNKKLHHLTGFQIFMYVLEAVLTSDANYPFQTQFWTNKENP